MSIPINGLVMHSTVESPSISTEVIRERGILELNVDISMGRVPVECYCSGGPLSADSGLASQGGKKSCDRPVVINIDNIEVPGSKFQIPDSRFQSSRFQIPDFRFQISVSQDQPTFQR